MFSDLKISPISPVRWAEAPSLTVDNSSGIAVSVGGVNNSPAAKVVGLFGAEILPVTAVHHPVGISVPAAGGEHLSGEPGSFIIHVVESWSLEEGKHPEFNWKWIMGNIQSPSVVCEEWAAQR